MDIVVHGTKGGRQIFTPKKLGGLLDVNSDAPKATAIGQEAFAIRFVEKSIIFSKYKIIRDVRGDKRTGFLAFSLFLPNNKKLQGKDILSVLNKVSGEYYRIHIPDNDNNLKDVREDWAFLEDIVKEFRTDDRHVDDIESLLSGTKDDAFIYYENEEKLQKYFDAPYQDKYSKYRQVLFVKEELKDKPEDPLNALRHSENPNDNLTGKIDLEKKAYALRDYDGQAKNGISIEIRVGGKLLYKKDKINNNDLISIRYFRKYSEALVVKEGRLNDDWIRKYLFVDEENRKIDVEKNINLDPVIKTVSFDIKDWKGNTIRDAEIICKRGNESKSVINNQISFEGEEIGKHWNVSAKKEENLYSETKGMIPENENDVKLELNEHKKVKFLVSDSDTGQDIDKFKVWIQGKVDTREISEFDFIGNDVEKKWNITFEKQGYHRSERIEYFPATGESTIQEKLKKKDPQLGQSKENVPHPQYKRKEPFYQKPKLMAALIAGTILLIFTIGALFSLSESNPPEPNQQPSSQHIKAYIEGNSLILDTLNSYKKTLSSGTELKEVIDSLDSAIKKRDFVNNWNFDALKKLHYYSAQQNFDTTIKKIKNSQYDSVKSRFGDVSSWDLNQIADAINAFLNATKPATEKKTEVKKDVAEEIKKEPQKKVTLPVKTEQKNEEKQVSIPTSTNNSRDVAKELQSGAVTRNDLQSWKSGGMDKYKKSIDLYLDFWASIKQSMQMDDSRQLLNKINNDKYLQKSELQSFLKSVCASSESFKKYNDTPGKAACKTLNELRSKVK